MIEGCTLDIVLVDDDKECLKGLTFPLEAFGHRVRKFISPLQAIGEYQKEKADVVITDYKMSEMNGMDLFLNLKRMDRWVKVILVTAYGDLELVNKAINNQIFGFIAKPINIKKLFELIDILCQQKKMQNICNAKLSHEIKNPLHAIINSLELMRMECNNVQQQNSIDLIKENIFYINDILDLYTNINQKNYDEHKTAKFNLDKVAKNAVRLLQSDIKNKNPTLKYSYDSDLPEFFEAGKNNIKQILFNLIGNAIKYTEKGSIEIIIQRVEKSNHYINNENIELVRISVKDTGIGIKQEDQERIFDDYYKECNSGQKSKGLGLSIIKEIAARMEGTITVDSVPGCGSTFIIRVDMENALDYSKDMADWLHPNPVGYKKIAGKWFEALDAWFKL